MSERIPRLDMDDLPPALAEALRPRVERLGYLGEFFRCAAHAPDALLAFDVFTYRVAQAAAAMAVALGGLDVLAFSGGVGENRADVREAVSGRLRCLGDFRTEVVHAREDLVIAEAALDLVQR